MPYKKEKSDLHHRSKARVQCLGEVFTPEAYVHDMLELVENKAWADLDSVFFEPCCGHGNFVIAILNKRMQAFKKKFQKAKQKNAVHYAIANSINTMWAIDIDKKNIIECRERVFLTVIEFLSNSINQNTNATFERNRDFIAHVACAIYWHIHENETLSCLGDINTAKLNAKKTKSGLRWTEKNGIKSLDFQNTWCEYYKHCEKKNSVPIVYERALKAIDNVIHYKNIKVKDFEFVSMADIQKDIETIKKKLARGTPK